MIPLYVNPYGLTVFPDLILASNNGIAVLIYPGLCQRPACHRSASAQFEPCLIWHYSVKVRAHTNWETQRHRLPATFALHLYSLKFESQQAQTLMDWHIMSIPAFMYHGFGKTMGIEWSSVLIVFKRMQDFKKGGRGLAKDHLRSLASRTGNYLNVAVFTMKTAYQFMSRT
jgi:hypothetical protein